MATVFENYDAARTAFINPGDCVKAQENFPEVCITTFSESIIEDFAKKNSAEKIAELYTANGVLPVYGIEYAGIRMAFYLSRVGAPACVAGLEEMIAMGAKKMIIFGCCGVLDEVEVQDKIIIPSSTIRDEGTSYHYLPAGEEIGLEDSCAGILEDCLVKTGMPYVKGKIWTTDGIYRETHGRLKERREQGCIAVEMECSAVLAVCRFRGVPAIQFLYGADNLSTDKWEPMDLMEYGIRECDRYMALALECGGRL